MDIDVRLVTALIAAQFPQYADLPVSAVLPGGNDNRTFRVGADLCARLPGAPGYVAAVAKEHQWLPTLAPELPVSIPEPVGLGVPGSGYPWPWSLNRWLPGTTLLGTPEVDREQLAASLGSFLTTLRRVDGSDGPAAGEHSFYRGASLLHYDAEVKSALRTSAEAAVWDTAVASEWHGEPTWFHGDIADGNLLIKDGRLSAVIDWGTSGVGDPACDLVIAWTYFEGDERQIFAAEVGLDAAAWARARGWALWKALITGDPAAEHVVREVLRDPVVAG